MPAKKKCDLILFFYSIEYQACTLGNVIVMLRFATYYYVARIWLYRLTAHSGNIGISYKADSKKVALYTYLPVSVGTSEIQITEMLCLVTGKGIPLKIEIP